MIPFQFFLEVQNRDQQSNRWRILLLSLDADQVIVQQVFEMAQSENIRPKFAFALKRIAIEHIKEGLNHKTRYRLGFLNWSNPQSNTAITYSALSLNQKYQLQNIQFSPSAQYMAFEALYEGNPHREIHIYQLDRLKNPLNFKEVPISGVVLDSPLSVVQPKFISQNSCLCLQQINEQQWEIANIQFLETNADSKADSSAKRFKSAQIQLLTQQAFVCPLYEVFYLEQKQILIWVGWHENGGVAIYTYQASSKSKFKRVLCSGAFSAFKNLILDQESARFYYIGQIGESAEIGMIDFQNTIHSQMIRKADHFDDIWMAVQAQNLILIEQTIKDEFESSEQTTTSIADTTSFDQSIDSNSYVTHCEIYSTKDWMQMATFELDFTGKISETISIQTSDMQSIQNDFQQSEILEKKPLLIKDTQSSFQTLELSAISLIDDDSSFMDEEIFDSQNATEISEFFQKQKSKEINLVKPEDIRLDQIHTLEQVHTLPSEPNAIFIEQSQNTQVETIPMKRVNPLEMQLIENFPLWLKNCMQAEQPLEEIKKLQAFQHHVQIEKQAILFLEQILKNPPSQDQSFILVFLISAFFLLDSQKARDLIFEYYQKQVQLKNPDLYESIEYYFMIRLLACHTGIVETFNPLEIFEEFQSVQQQIYALFDQQAFDQALQLKQQVEQYQQEIWQLLIQIIKPKVDTSAQIQKPSFQSISQISPHIQNQLHTKEPEFLDSFVQRLQSSSTNISIEQLNQIELQQLQPVAQPIIVQPVAQPIIVQPVAQQPVPKMSLETELVNDFSGWLMRAMESDHPLETIKQLSQFQTHPLIQSKAIEALTQLIIYRSDDQQRTLALTFVISACVYLDAMDSVKLCSDWYRAMYQQKKPTLYESVEYYFCLNLLLYLLNLSSSFNPSQIFDEFQSTLDQIEALFTNGLIDQAMSLKKSMDEHQRNLWQTVENHLIQANQKLSIQAQPQAQPQAYQPINVSLVNAISPYQQGHQPIRTEALTSTDFSQMLQQHSSQLKISDLEAYERKANKQNMYPQQNYDPFSPFAGIEMASNLIDQHALYAEDDQNQSYQNQSYQNQSYQNQSYQSNQSYHDQSNHESNHAYPSSSMFQNSWHVLQSQLSDLDLLTVPSMLKNVLLIQVLFALVHLFLMAYLGTKITILMLLFLVSAFFTFQRSAWAHKLSIILYFIYPFFINQQINTKLFAMSGLKSPLWYIFMGLSLILAILMMNDKIRKFINQNEIY
jgi:hypothetical protein